MVEEVLITVRVDKPKNQDELTKLTGQIIAQKNEIKQLEAAVKTLSKAEGDNNELIKGATKNLEIKKQQLNQNVASQKALVNVINAEVKSLNALKAENVQLIRQRNALNTETEEGRQGIARLNQQIDGNNNKIRENSSALEKQKINIGNYGSALSGISPALGGFVSGMQNMVVAAKAFIATPLGLILTGIAVAVAPLVSFFKDTAAGADAAGEEAEGFSLVMDVIKDQINEIGGEQFNLFDGLLLGLKQSLPAFGALMNAYDEVAKAGREYGKALDELNDKQAKFNVEAAFTQNEIAKLVIQSKDRTKSEAERLKILDEIIRKEEQLAQQRKDFAQAELSATLQRNEARLTEVGIIQDSGESQLDFAKRAVDAIRESSLSQGDALADLLLKNLKNFADAEAESISILGKAQNKQNELLDKQAEADQKRREDIRKQKEKEKEDQDKIDKKADEDEYEYQKGLIEQANEDAEEQAKIEQDQADYNANLVKQRADKQVKEQQERAKRQAAATQQFAELTGGIIAAAIAGNNKVAKELGKQLAVTLIDVFTRQLSAQAVADSIAKFGPILGPIRGAVSVGLIQAISSVAKGAIQSFAVGGIAQGPSHSRGGIPFTVAGRGGFEMEGGEAIINKRSTAMFKNQLSAINQAGGGKAFAVGGIAANETRIAATRAESQFDINQMASLLNQVRTVLVVEDYEAKKAEIVGNQSRATVIG